MRTKRIVYYDAGPVEDDRGLYHVGLVVGYSLLLSNSIRRDTVVVVDMSYRGIDTRLTVKGWKVRNLRLDASSLRGFMRHALAGRIKGVEVAQPSRPIEAEACIYTLIPALPPDTIIPGFCPTLRSFRVVGIVLSEGRIVCRYRIACRLNLDKVWLKAGVAQLMLDRWLEDAPTVR